MNIKSNLTLFFGGEKTDTLLQMKHGQCVSDLWNRNQFSLIFVRVGSFWGFFLTKNLIYFFKSL